MAIGTEIPVSLYHDLFPLLIFLCFLLISFVVMFKLRAPVSGDFMYDL